MNIQLTMAARYLNGRKLRTFLTTLAIVFGVLVIFGMNTVLPAFIQAFQANTLAAAGQVDSTITLKTADAFDTALTDRVAAVQGVRVVSGFLNRNINLPVDYLDNDPERPDVAAALSLVGINVDQATAVHSYVIQEGRFLTANDMDAAVISESLADNAEISVGDTLTLPTPGGERALTVIGILPPRLQAGNEEVLVTLTQAQEMLNMPGRINTIEANFDTLDADEREVIEAAILSTLGENFQIGALDTNSELLNNLRLGQTMMNLLGLLALLMGAFIIFNTFRTVLAERRRDIGMLRALGASRRTVFGIFTIEGLIQGIIGTIIGIALGFILGYLLIEVVSPVIQRFMSVELGGPVITPFLIIVSFVVGVGVTLLAALWPAMSASRVTPMEALRPSIGSLSLRKMTGLGFWIGVGFIVVAVVALFLRNPALIGIGAVLFLLGLLLVSPALVNPIAKMFGSLLSVFFARGGTAELAEGNLTRQPSRAAITAATMMIGMAILVMGAGMIASVYIGFGNVMRKSLGSDYIFVPPSIAIWGTNVGAGEELTETLRADEDVEIVSALRFAPTQFDGTSVAVLGIDPATYPAVSGLTFSEGDDEAYQALASGRAIILNPVAALTAQVGVGDELSLATPTGSALYRVAAIGGDYLNAKIPTAYISHESIAADFGREEDVLLQLNLKPGTDTVAAEERFKAALRDYPQFRLISGQEYIEENLRLFDAAFSGLYAMAIFLAIPSVIAMINTLAIGVIERTREIGMLRAVGASRGQVRRIVLSEALILGGLGTALGILAGLYLSYMVIEAFKAAGYPMEYVFPLAGVLIALAAGLIFASIAAILPARQASQLEIIKALRYE